MTIKSLPASADTPLRFGLRTLLGFVTLWGVVLGGTALKWRSYQTEAEVLRKQLAQSMKDVDDRRERVTAALEELNRRARGNAVPPYQVPPKYIAAYRDQLPPARIAHDKVVAERKALVASERNARVTLRIFWAALGVYALLIVLFLCALAKNRFSVERNRITRDSIVVT